MVEIVPDRNLAKVCTRNVESFIGNILNTRCHLQKPPTGYRDKDFYHSVSILSSLGDNCLFSDSESRLGFVETASTSPSDDRFNPVDPDDDPKKLRTGASDGDDAE
ncbi:hypothetical protein V6N12_003990 [Hibiscus sabdariffa]|uniref:Uncharacterized protein n=1 Tax=Hibiscus sabdariffa TaxID=183260 RepID=A0ABR2CKV1_9ROSI